MIHGAGTAAGSGLDGWPGRMADDLVVGGMGAGASPRPPAHERSVHLLDGRKGPPGQDMIADDEDLSFNASLSGRFLAFATPDETLQLHSRRKGELVIAGARVEVQTPVPGTALEDPGGLDVIRSGAGKAVVHDEAHP